MVQESEMQIRQIAAQQALTCTRRQRQERSSLNSAAATARGSQPPRTSHGTDTHMLRAGTSKQRAQTQFKTSQTPPVSDRKRELIRRRPSSATQQKQSQRSGPSAALKGLRATASLPAAPAPDEAAVEDTVPATAVSAVESG